MAYRPILVIHGGAGSRHIGAREKKILSESLLRITKEIYPLLARGGSSLEAVTRAVVLLENDPLYNAGFGSKIQSDGHIRMSAAVMDSASRRFGGCVNVEGVKNPVLLARALMRKRDRVLSNLGAKKFARQIGLTFSSPFTPKQLKAYQKKKAGRTGTVGAVALDMNGKLAAATSTGGRGFEYPYRVSDSPTTAGNFASSLAAVSATGTGEEIVENAAAATICAFVETGWSLKKSVSHLLKRSAAKGGHFGMIAVTRKGEIVGQSNTPTLLWASCDGQSFTVFGRKV